MTTGENTASQTTKTLYAILNCTEEASYAELKRNYQLLIREFHPDKNSKQQEQQQCDKFREIDNAWKILRDDHQRKIYDATLIQENVDSNCLIYAELDRNNLNFDTEDTSTYQCRCGSDFVILRSYLDNEDECIIECSDCSNCIRVR